MNEAGPGRAASGCGDPSEPLGDRPWAGAGRGRGVCVVQLFAGSLLLTVIK